MDEDLDHLPSGVPGLNDILLPDFALRGVVAGDDLYGKRVHGRGLSDDGTL
jgi:hypothetical protein